MTKEEVNKILEYQCVFIKYLMELEKLLLPPGSRMYSEKDLLFYKRLMEGN